MNYLVGNPEDRFSRDEAQLILCSPYRNSNLSCETSSCDFLNCSRNFSVTQVAIMLVPSSVYF